MADSKEVIFKFSVSGAISTLTVFENDEEVVTKRRNGTYEGKFERDLPSSGEVEVVCVLAGLNGTAYEIKYDCNLKNKNYSDPENTSPISGNIIKFNAKMERVKIKSPIIS